MPEALFMVFQLDSKGAKEALFLVFRLESQGAGPCASSGGRLPAELFMVFLSDFTSAKVWIQKVQKCINLVDLVKSFQTSI